jgi:hypothetical protein
MALDEQQQRFLARRRRLTRFWPLGGTALLAMVLALLIGLYLRVPLLVDPFAVAEQLHAGSIEEATLLLMAALLPLLSLACFLLLVALILFMFAAFANERRYLRAIDSLLDTERKDDGG